MTIYNFEIVETKTGGEGRADTVKSLSAERSRLALTPCGCCAAGGLRIASLQSDRADSGEKPPHLQPVASRSGKCEADLLDVPSLIPGWYRYNRQRKRP